MIIKRKTIKHKKVLKPYKKLRKIRRKAIKNKIKEYNVELEELQKEIDELTIRKIEIRVIINKFEFNLESV